MLDQLDHEEVTFAARVGDARKSVKGSDLSILG
jgi:hypothetical protein